MTIVELLERLKAEHQIELVWWDRAGAVWSSPPPDEARPAIEQLSVELEYAVRGAGTGHQWGQCAQCGLAQLVPTKSRKGRTCRMTPYCRGEVGRWVELPAAAKAWETLKLARKVAMKAAQPKLVIKPKGE